MVARQTCVKAGLLGECRRFGYSYDMDQPKTRMAPDPLLGIGLYTPSEASRLLGVNHTKIIRWLNGHRVREKAYQPLWSSQVELNDGHVYLGFRDLMEVRVADAFISVAGLSPQRVRRAIEIARDLTGDTHPLSTTRFRTDGRTIFLQVAREDGGAELIDIFRRQLTFREIIEPSLKNIDFEPSGIPARWWPLGRSGRIVLDPKRAFGRPIESDSAVPSAILAAAATAEGSEAGAARVWNVKVTSVRRAVEFEAAIENRKAA